MPWKKMSCEEANNALDDARGNLNSYNAYLEKFTRTGDDQIFKILEGGPEELGFYTEKLYDGLSGVELSIKKAKEIMGEDFYGPDEFKEAFKVEADLEKLGRIPFTLQELQSAKTWGMKLIMRYEPKDGEAITINRLREKRVTVNVPVKGEILSAKNGWVLVTDKPHRLENHAPYEHIIESWRLAKDFFTGDEHSSVAKKLHKLASHLGMLVSKTGMRRSSNLAELIKDSKDNVFSSSWNKYMPSMGDAVYDFFLRHGGQVNEDIRSFDIVTASIGGSDFFPREKGFLTVKQDFISSSQILSDVRLRLNEQTDIEKETTTRMYYQITA